MQAFMWPLVSKITVISPPKLGQFGVRDGFIQRTAYWGIMEVKGDHPDFCWLLHHMRIGTTISSNLQEDILNWGSMRVDLAHEEYNIKSKTFQEHPLIPTWRYLKLKFPNLQMLKEEGELPKATQTGWRLSMDIEGTKENISYMDHLIRHNGITLPEGVIINPVHRRSYGNVNYDRLQAWMSL